MFDDIDYFLSFGDKRHFVQKQGYLCETFFFDTKINVQLDSK